MGRRQRENPEKDLLQFESTEYGSEQEWTKSSILHPCCKASLTLPGTAAQAACRYTGHQTGWSQYTSSFSFAIQRHFWPTCSKHWCQRPFVSLIPKQNHHLNSNIINPRTELDHKENQSKPDEWTLLLWGRIFNLLLLEVEVQQTSPRASKPWVTF